MPLKNDVNKMWGDWLIDGLGGQEDAYQNVLDTALQSRQIPKYSVKPGTLNIWNQFMGWQSN